MEEIHRAALAYYENLSQEQKQSATDFFCKLDTNRDGRISLDEFLNVLGKEYRNIASPTFFANFDRDQNGTLDFWEFLTLYYIIITKRLIFCKACRIFLYGLYFTCIKCFSEGSGNTYDLCCDCYKRRCFGSDHKKSHTIFLDNYALVRANSHIKSSTSKLEKAIEAFNFGVTVGTAIGSLCSIM